MRQQSPRDYPFSEAFPLHSADSISFSDNNQNQRHVSWQPVENVITEHVAFWPENSQIGEDSKKIKHELLQSCALEALQRLPFV